MEAALPNAENQEAWEGVLFERFTEYRHIVTTGLGNHGTRALEIYPPSPGDRVLDVGCGFGDLTLQIAGLVGPDGHVTGADISRMFVEQARKEAAEAGCANVSFEAADLQVEVPGKDSPYDGVYSRMGTMFFISPVAALRKIREAIKPGGRLTMVVWRAKSENAYMHTAEQIAERYLTHPDQTDEPTCGPGPFSMANADTTSGILVGAGFEQITLTRSDIPIMIGSDVEEALSFATALGPTGELIRVNGDAGEAARPKIEADLREALGWMTDEDGRVWGDASTWIVSAVNPG